MVHLGHDFLGREALVSRKDDPHRVKVTLEWNNQDVFDVMRRAVGTRNSADQSSFLYLYRCMRPLNMMKFS